MAKITLTIEDTPDGNVKVVCTPSFEDMMKMETSGTALTSAHGYALFALNKIREESKRKTPTSIYIPKLGRH